MAEFTPITTQEDFDKAVSERVKKEREAVKKEFSGYLSPEDAAKRYEGYLSPDDVKKQYAGYLSPEEAAEKDKKIKGYEMDSVKTKIALETGLPYEMAGRLTGEDEAAIRKDAEAISKLLGQSHGTPPLRSAESGEDTKRAAYKTMLSDLKGE